MSEQLRISRELTEQKTQKDESDDDEDTENHPDLQEEAKNDDLKLLFKTDDQKDNPWLLGQKGQQIEDIDRKSKLQTVFSHESVTILVEILSVSKRLLRHISLLLLKKCLLMIQIAVL